MAPTFSFEWNEEVLDHLCKDSDAFNPPFDCGFFLYVVFYFWIFFFFLPDQTCRCYSGCQTTGLPYKPAPEGENGSVAVAGTQITRVQKPQRDKTKDDHHHRHSGLALAMTVQLICSRMEENNYTEFTRGADCWFTVSETGLLFKHVKGNRWMYSTGSLTRVSRDKMF